MIAKCFEIRDSGTFIPMLAVKLNSDCEGDRYLLARAGFGSQPKQQAEYVYLIRIDGGQGAATCDPYDWGQNPRTMINAHRFIIEHFDSLAAGAVIDVEFILGETKVQKVSERLES